MLYYSHNDSKKSPTEFRKLAQSTTFSDPQSPVPVHVPQDVTNSTGKDAVTFLGLFPFAKDEIDNSAAKANTNDNFFML